MGTYIAGQLVKKLLSERIQVQGARVLIMGLTFKENCPDLRNTRVVDVVEELAEFGVAVDVYDPWVDSSEAKDEYDIMPIEHPEAGAYDGVVIAVAHDVFKEMGFSKLRSLGKPNAHVLYDLKYILSADQSDLRL
jgi:UDP-N-acetyl-D-galactosamine dehydrogenase